MLTFMHRIVVWCKNLKIIHGMAKDAANRCKDCMNSGVWHIRMAEKPMLVHRTKESMSFYDRSKRSMDNFLGKRAIGPRIRDLLLRLSWHCFVTKEPKGNVHADCIMFSINGGVYLYDFNANIVEKHHTQDRINDGYLRLEQAGYWRAFSSPVLQIKEKISLERIVSSQNEKITDREQYIQVLKGYALYLSKATPTMCERLGEIAERCQESIPDYNLFFPNDILSAPINSYMLHGDLTKLNVLYTGEEKVMIIDYARVGANPFFYDLLLWPCMEIWHNADWDLWHELEDSNTVIGRIFNEILTAQGISTEVRVKRALLILVPVIWSTLTKLDEQVSINWKMDAVAQKRMALIASGLNNEIRGGVGDRAKDQSNDR